MTLNESLNKITMKNTKLISEEDIVVHQLPVLVTLEEYMPGEWFKLVEEEDEEEVLCFCGIILIIDF